MTLRNTTVLYIVELALYLILAPLIAYLAFRHGKHGILGFFYLNIFAVLRVISDIIFIAQRNNATPSTAAAILSSIGLSPLLLALAGFIDEEHVYLVHATHAAPKAKQINKYMWIAQIVFHMAALAGIAIVVVGTTGLIDAQKPDGNKSDIGKDQDLREAGSVLLLLVWGTLVVYAAWVLREVVRTSSPVRTSLRVFAICVVVGSVFVGVRAVYGVVYSFDHGSKSLSPITGSFAVKVVLVVLVQLGAVITFVVGLWATRNIKREQYAYQPARLGSPGERVELVPPRQGYVGGGWYKMGGQAQV